jgi:ureidoacrylate peracid hydrolase
MHQINIPPHAIERAIRRQGRRYAYDRINPRSTALAVVDMQNYFVDMEKYFMADDDDRRPEFRHGRDIVPNINRLSESLREAGGHVIWVLNAAPEETLSSWANFYEMYKRENWARRMAGLAEGTPGYALWEGLHQSPQDLVSVKTRYSALIPGSSDLEALLRKRGIDTLLIAGISTNVCCESTARDAMMLGYRTVMVSDALATMTDEEHNAALINFMMFFGDVQSTDVAIDHIAQGIRASA